MQDEKSHGDEKSQSSVPVIEFCDVCKEYQLSDEVKVPVLHEINFQIHRGDFVAIIGASGSGKSTVMNLMGCLDTPTKGKVYIDGIEISKMNEDELAEIRGKKIGFIFQQFNLLGALDCKENVALPLFFRKSSKKLETDGEVMRLIRAVGLEHRVDHRPLEMSGGEQQRAAIARSLVNDPEIVLADEPTGNLDSVTGEKIMDVLRELNSRGKTIIIITHNPEIADEAKTVLHLKDGKLMRR